MDSSRERSASGLVVCDHWSALRAHTPANIAIGRVGHSLPTREVLRFGLAHAQARDAVHVALDGARLAADLAAAGWASVAMQSAADSRPTYLRRPDLGRRLSEESARRNDALANPGASPPDLCLVIADGLSSVAAQTHAVPLLGALRERWRGTAGGDRSGSCARVVIATQARVALGDEIAERLRARMVVVLIGERPGFGPTDSFLDLHLIDSTGFLELITYLEETFAIVVKDEEMLPENLDSLQAIEAYLARKQAT